MKPDRTTARATRNAPPPDFVLRVPEERWLQSIAERLRGEPIEVQNLLELFNLWAWAEVRKGSLGDSLSADRMLWYAFEAPPEGLDLRDFGELGQAGDERFRALFPEAAELDAEWTATPPPQTPAERLRAPRTISEGPKEE